jgi:uncharacterized damage-inducible protein DinB
MTEPWLRGPIEEVHPLLTPILYSFQQAHEDLRHWTQGLSTSQLWSRPLGLGSVGFHIRHIGGSIERLMTYTSGRQLSPEQLSELEREMEPGEDLADLLAGLDRSLLAAEQIVRKLDPATLTDLRQVGRKRLPSTVGGLLTHIAEHTQRHVGQAIITAKILAHHFNVVPNALS